LRAGDLSRGGVVWAARLGDPAALLLVPDAEPVDWSEWTERRDAIEGVSKTVAGRRWKRVAVSFSVDCAERVLHLFEEERPGDNRPRKALELARRWENGKRVSREELERARRAAFAAATHAHAAYYAAAAAAAASDAAYAGGYAAAAAYAAAADYAADYAAYASAHAASSATIAAHSTRAAHAKFFQSDLLDMILAMEQAWQKARLASYALGEIEWQ